VTFESGSRLSSIQPFAFRNCRSLQSAFLPATLREFGGWAFAKIPLANIAVDPANPHFKVCGDFVVTADELSAVRYFGTDEEVHIGGPIERLDSGCFDGVATLCRVTFEPYWGVSVFGDSCFEYSGLQSICIPASITAIPDSCFGYCDRLASVTFEEGGQVSVFAASSFASSGLKSISIPSSVRRLAMNAFRSCKGLSTVTFESPATISVLGEFCFCWCTSLRSICIPASVEVIERSCFLGDDCLSSVTIKSGSRLVRMGEGTFSDCYGLRSLIIPSSIEWICRAHLHESMQYIDVNSGFPLNSTRT
jgi:hypothetical protein